MDKKKFDEMAETIIEEYCLEWGDRPDIEAFVAYARKGFEVQHGEYVHPSSKPVAWAATSPHGDVLHISEADGWKVEPVIFDGGISRPAGTTDADQA